MSVTKWPARWAQKCPQQSRVFFFYRLDGDNIVRDKWRVVFLNIGWMDSKHVCNSVTKWRLFFLTGSMETKMSVTKRRVP